MAYEKTTWIEGITPLSPNNMNKIEQGIYDAHQEKAPLASPALTGTPTAPTADADTNTTQLATTAFVVGQAGASTPAMDGTGTVGTSKKYARQDHVHPTDTSRGAATDLTTHTGNTTTAHGAVSTATANKVVVRDSSGRAKFAAPAAVGDAVTYGSDKLLADTTIYVNASTGSDTTGDGSSGNPYASISKALSAIPKNLGGYAATISISDGTYTENLDIRYYYNGVLSIGTSGNTVNLNGYVLASSSKNIQLFLDAITGNGTDHCISSTHGSIVKIMKNCTLDATTAKYGLNASAGGIISIDNITVTINNCLRAVSATTLGRVYAYALNGAGSTTGLYSFNGSLIAYSTNGLGATTATSTGSGGRILAGAQSSIPNY